MKRLIIPLVFSLMALVTSAEEPDSTAARRVVTSAFMIETGSAHIADTYLTPLHYRGAHHGFMYERSQPMRFNPDEWTMQLRLTLDLDHTFSPTKNAAMYSGGIKGAWAMMHRTSVLPGVNLGIGPGTSLDLGVLYLRRNSNNPASAKAAWTVNASGYASWRLSMGRFNTTLLYQATLPVAGVFFSPDYGELYYQIMLNTHDQLAHFACWGKYFAMDNLISADLHFGNTSVRVGYHNSILSTKVNHLVTRDIMHALVVGVTTEWISLRPNSSRVDTRLINAY